MRTFQGMRRNDIEQLEFLVQILPVCSRSFLKGLKLFHRTQFIFPDVRATFFYYMHLE